MLINLLTINLEVSTLYKDIFVLFSNFVPVIKYEKMSFLQHEDYSVDISGSPNDVGLLKLDTPVEYDEKMSPSMSTGDHGLRFPGASVLHYRMGPH